MAAYVVIEAIIKDSDKFANYAQHAPELVSRFGGEYLSARSETEGLEGDWDNLRLAIQRWPDMASARRFWNSQEYAELKKLREGSGDFRVVLLDGSEP